MDFVVASCPWFLDLFPGLLGFFFRIFGCHVGFVSLFFGLYFEIVSISFRLQEFGVDFQVSLNGFRGFWTFSRLPKFEKN